MNKRLLPFFVIVNVIVSPLTAHARPDGAYAECIEWITADSERVLVGKVVKVETAKGEDNKDYEVATVAVSQTLKGKHETKATFLLQNHEEPVAAEWMEDAVPMLFFLVRSDRLDKKSGLATRFDWVLREDVSYPSAVLVGKSKRDWTYTMHVFGRELSVVTKSDAIVKRVERAATAFSRRPNHHAVGVPKKNEIYKQFVEPSAVYLVVPVDEELEPFGRNWCRSAWPFERKEGIKILRRFKSERNIQILKSLLNDHYSDLATRYRLVIGLHVLAVPHRHRVYAVRRLAYETLRDLGVPVEKPVLEEPLGKEAVVEGKSFSQWIEMLDDFRDSSTREGVRDAMKHMASTCREAVPFLIDTLKDEDRERRSWAALALSYNLPEWAKDSLPALVDKLTDEDWEVRSKALAVLGGLGLEVRPAIPAVIEVLKDPESQVRSQAIEFLGWLPLEPQLVVPALVDALDVKRDDRRLVVKSLARFGPKAKAGVPSLLKILQEPEHPEGHRDGLRETVIHALGEIRSHGKLVVPVLLPLLKDESLRVQDETMDTLTKLGPEAKDALPTLFEIAKDKASDLRPNALYAIAVVGPDHKDVIPMLISALEDKDGSVQKFAVNALAHIGPPAKAAIPALSKVLRAKENDWLLDFAIDAFAKIGVEDKEVLPILIQALEPGNECHSSAAKALGEIGPAAKQAVPALLKLLSDKDPAVRKTVGEALKKIDPAAAKKAGVP